MTRFDAPIMEMLDNLVATSLLLSDRPTGLHGRYYTAPEFFEYEMSNLLRAGWHCIGRVDELESPGDYYTIDVLGEPLLVAMGDDKVTRVFANVCRHRQMLVAEGSGNTKRFVCPYHAWSYARDGKLVRAAHMVNAGFDAAACGLEQYASEEWNGFIYVNLSNDPGPLAGSLEEIEKSVNPYEPERFRIVHTALETWHCNWKCLVENFMEGYHLSVVHPETLRGYTPTELCTKGPDGPGFTSYNANYPDNIPSRGHGSPELDEKQRHRSFLFSIFPTQVVSQAASLLVSLSLNPVAVNKTLVRWTMSVFEDDLDEAMIEERIRLWTEVNKEDREKLETLQYSLGSSRANQGPLAGDNFEGTIRDFHRYLAAGLAD